MDVWEGTGYLMDKLQERLHKIGNDMVQQDCRITQNVLFVVQETVERVVPMGLADERRRVDCDSPDYWKGMCETCAAMDENGDCLPDDCQDCDDNLFYWVAIERDLNFEAGVFFTEAACDAHIKQNHYHYNEPRSYGISAWRNPEMQAVMNDLIINHAGIDLPAKYDKFI